jgi:hypothetical protein
MIDPFSTGLSVGGVPWMQFDWRDLPLARVTTSDRTASENDKIK